MSEPPREAPRVEHVTVDEHSDGQRLDNFLLARLKGVPKSWVYRVLRRGEVRVNKGRCKPASRLHSGDVVRIPPLRIAPAEAVEPPKFATKEIVNSIIYEDALVLAVNKPSGMAVHGGSGLAFGVIEALRSARPTAPFLELVHRLDRDTSGCLLIAKKRSALTALQELLRGGRIEKRYLALLAGRIRKGAWRTDLPLRKNTLQGGERIVRVDPTGKPAATRFRVLRRFADATLVEAELETGRTHQIRVHALATGHPIVGDPKYADDAAREIARRIGLSRLFLHATSLRFDWTGARGGMTLEAPMPPELVAVIEKLDEKAVSTYCI